MGRISMSWISQIFSRRRRYDDITVSIAEHIAERADELAEKGMSPREAEQAARREFGNAALIAQQSREAWQWPALESLLADLRMALRRMRKAPGFAATVIVTLAIGIGANTAVFSVLNSVILKPLAYPDSDRLVALRLNAPGAAGLANFADGLPLSSSMYLTFARHNRSFESMGVWVPGTANVTGLAKPEEVRFIAISDGVLQSLDVPAVAGRWLLAADQNPHGRKTVMLTYGYWQRRFGGDPSVVGKSIQVDAEAYEIVGVMPRGFKILNQDTDLLAPLAFDPTNQKLAGFGFNGLARLKPGVTIAQANADIKPLINVWMDSWTNGPGTNPHFYDVWQITPDFRPLKQQVIGDVGKVLWTVMGTIGLVMLIACANIANLLLVRAEARQQELSIRSALGAGRMRIARELLTESLALSLLGGAAAIAVAFGALRLLLALGPAELPRLGEIALDARSLLFALALSAFSGLLIGLMPVWKHARSTGPLMLGGASRTVSAGRSQRSSRNMLVVAQVAIALVLMVSALLMIRTFISLRSVEPGFADQEHVETLSVGIPKLLAPDPHAVARMQQQIAERLSAIPGVTSAAFAAAIPMDNDDPNWDTIAVEGEKYQGGDGPLRLYNYVSPGYFRTMGTRLVAGRDFTWDDLNNVSPMLIVTENFAVENWGSASAAIGKRIKKYSSSPWQEVIGVVEDVRVHGVDQAPPSIIYWPAMFYDRFGTSPGMDGLRSVVFVVHSRRAGTAGLLGPMQQAVWAVNADLPLASVGTMQQLYAQSMARTSFTLVMLAIAGSMALALGILGIYGVISYSVTQRTREIGVRLALGAPKGQLQWLFVRAALMLTGVGVVLGLGAAALLSRAMRSLLYGISPLDPLTFAAVPVILAAAAVLASYLPARRAAAVDPVEALRAE